MIRKLLSQFQKLVGFLLYKNIPLNSTCNITFQPNLFCGVYLDIRDFILPIFFIQIQ